MATVKQDLHQSCNVVDPETDWVKLPDLNEGLGAKNNAGKPPLSWIPRSAMIAEAEVLAFGAVKYARDNWRKGLLWSEVLDAALRHVYAFVDGEDVDQETGLSHLAHARCELGFLLEFLDTHPELDDRGSKA